MDILKEELEKKENHIKELKIQMAKLLEEKNKDILKMKIQVMLDWCCNFGLFLKLLILMYSVKLSVT